MINLEVYIDDEFYAILNCEDDGDLRNHRLSNDGKIYTYWENQFLDGGTAHIIEFTNHKYWVENRYGEDFSDFVLARTREEGVYSSGKKYVHWWASKAKDLVAKEWKTASGRKVVFKYQD